MLSPKIRDRGADAFPLLQDTEIFSPKYCCESIFSMAESGPGSVSSNEPRPAATWAVVKIRVPFLGYPKYYCRCRII